MGTNTAKTCNGTSIYVSVCLFHTTVLITVVCVTRMTSLSLHFFFYNAVFSERQAITL